MSVKSELLKLLNSSGENFVSGGDIAKKLSVSRNAVWKAIQSLRADGYNITAVTNKGYKLSDSGDVLSALGIMGHIKTENVFNIEVRNVVTSTNTILRELASDGEREGYVLAAQEQTAGKGRQGRKFYSPAGHGVYFSLLLRPGVRASDASLITSAAAVAAARAIEEVIGVDVGIKWVNDLFVEGKKVCGILTEAVFDMESGLVESVVLGIGINITRPKPGFPEEIRDIATALTDRSIGKDSERCRLIAATLNNFWGFYQNLEKREFLDEYRSRSIILDKEINVISFNNIRPAKAIEIDNNCGLLVRYESGEETVLSSGDVSIRV